MTKPIAIILAAGQGTRMQSDLPKVLCPILDRPMISHVLDAVESVGIERILVVVGYRSDEVRRQLADRHNLEFVEQSQRLGTGHAVQMCVEHFSEHQGAVLVLTGDSPLIQAKSLEHLLDHFDTEKPGCILGTLLKENPSGLGRILRDESDQFSGIVEEKDATQEQRSLKEVNMSTYLFDGPGLVLALSQLTDNNQQSEYYLTDCPGILVEHGMKVEALPVLQPCEALTINTVDELKLAEAEMIRMGY
jgi:bifunctional UDP-N-acetylglucosamine pyrophosphorylase/glucosamine-1-phosphate N-acetyltransferase/UDP-N-acetylglucosamine pyrophosphorylase